MGRKRRLPARAREKLVAEEAASAMEVEQKEAVLHRKPDKALFVVDAAGSGRKRRKVEKEAKAAKYISKNEKKLVVHKFLGKGKPRAAVRKRISDPWADEDQEEGSSNKEPQQALALSTSGKKEAEDSKPLLSLEGGAASEGTAAMEESSREADGRQGGEDFVTSPRVPGRNAKRPKQSVRNLAKLGVCHPGQSYNPAEEDHEDVLASAVAVELKRQEAIEEESAPISAGMSEETLAVIIGDEDDEESSDDEQDDSTTRLSLGKPTPASGKLTRAQRNKQKRAKAAKYELAVRRNRKQMIKSIDQVTALQQEVAEQERLREERRQTKRLLKAQKAKIEAEGAAAGGVFGPSAGVAAMSTKHQNNKDVIAGRSVPVNLGEELHGSLRQLKAQGSVLQDKVELLKANKAHPDRRRGKERAKKAPKGFKKKHTYKDRYKDD
ncbi:unnamed protein product [Ectocarpus fasciculatus]